MSGPPRNYKWADAEKGNTLALKHGAHSARAVAAVAEALRPHLTEPLDARAWIDDDVDAAEIDDWVTREALLRMLVNELARRIDENGRIVEGDQWLLTRINSAQNRAQSSRDRLLLNPMSRFRAGRDVAAAGVDLARLWADDPDPAPLTAEIEPQAPENED